MLPPAVSTSTIHTTSTLSLEKQHHLANASSPPCTADLSFSSIAFISAGRLFPNPPCSPNASREKPMSAFGIQSLQIPDANLLTARQPTTSTTTTYLPTSSLSSRNEGVSVVNRTPPLTPHTPTHHFLFSYTLFFSHQPMFPDISFFHILFNLVCVQTLSLESQYLVDHRRCCCCRLRSTDLDMFLLVFEMASSCKMV